MKTGELKDTEFITRDFVKNNLNVFATESPLAVAKDVQGLRAVFEEVYYLHLPVKINKISVFSSRWLIRCTNSLINDLISYIVVPSNFCDSYCFLFKFTIHFFVHHLCSLFRFILIQSGSFPLIIRFRNSLTILKLDTKHRLNFVVERKFFLFNFEPDWLNRIEHCLIGPIVAASYRWCHLCQPLLH